MLNSIFKKYILSGHERSIKAKKNIIYSFIIKGLNILISLAIVPLTINYVNPTRYGIWLTLSSIIAWFGFFDIGFGNGLRNKLAEAIAKKKYKLARIYISTTYFILTILILSLFVLFSVINPFLNWANLLNTDQNLSIELGKVAFVVFFFFSLQFVLQLLTVVLTANQQPAKASIFNLFGSAFSLILIFILTKTTQGSLVLLSLVLSFTPVLVLILSSLWFYFRELKAYAPSIKFVRLKFGKRIINLGLKFFVIQAAAIILYQTSNIIIAQMFTPKEVTPFNIAFKYFSIIPMIFSIVITPFWSAFTEAWTQQDYKWIRDVMKKLRIIWVILAILVVILILSADYVYFLWIGDKVTVTSNLTITIGIYVLINLWNGIYSQFLNGVGIIKLQLIMSIIGSLINIPLSVWFCKQFGVHGVVLSTIVISLPGLVIYPLQYNKIMNKTAEGIWVS